MKFIALAAACATALSFSTLPAAAGDASMKRSDGTELKTKCRNSGCSVTGKKPGGNWGTVEKTSGGTANFKKLKAKYEGLGFSG